MAMGTARNAGCLSFASVTGLPHVKSIAFYDRLNTVLVNSKFDEYAEEACRDCYPARRGRPSMPPSVYFRALLLAFFLGIDSERGVARQAGDSLSARRFLGYGLHVRTPSRSSLARARRRIPPGTQREVFAWALDRCREAQLGLRLPKAARASAALASSGGREPFREFVRELALPERERVASA